MYIEVEPGLIAVHTLPEDIMWSARIAILSFQKKVEEEEEEDLTAFGYDYVWMLSSKAPKWTGASLQSWVYCKNNTPESVWEAFFVLFLWHI